MSETIYGRVKSSVLHAFRAARNSGVPQAILANAVGGFNVVPSHLADGDVVATVFVPQDEFRLSDRQIEELFGVSRFLPRNEILSLLFEVGVEFGRAARQIEVDNLLMERADLLKMAGELRLALQDARSELEDHHHA